MNKQELKEMINTMYPEGEERWLKVKYLDSEKCLKSIRFNNKLDLGFEFTAIGTVAQYTPQVSALEELRSELSEYQELKGNKEVWVIIEQLLSNKIVQTLDNSIEYLEE